MTKAWRAGLWALALFAGGLCLPANSPVLAAEKGLSNKGEMLVQDNCGDCHAVGLTGDSPMAEAPPFRTLSAKYPVENLAEALAEGIVSGHPEMPIFVFKAHDVDAIIAYLETIQETPEADPEEAVDQ